MGKNRAIEVANKKKRPRKVSGAFHCPENENEGKSKLHVICWPADQERDEIKQGFFLVYLGRDNRHFLGNTKRKATDKKVTLLMAAFDIPNSLFRCLLQVKKFQDGKMEKRGLKKRDKPWRKSRFQSKACTSSKERDEIPLGRFNFRKSARRAAIFIP